MVKLPKFILPANSGQKFSDADFQNGIFILYLYPRDATPGCTLEAQNFRDLSADFEKIGVKIFGLSKDSEKSHDDFCAAENLNFPLLSDENHELIEKLGAWVEKSMFGKKYFGTDRATFVVKNGEIVREWRRVRVKNHADEVFHFCKNL